MLLVTLLIFALASCGKSQKVIEVDKLISDLGTGDILARQNAVESAYQAYELLSEKEKKQVEAPNILLTAKNDLDKSLAEVEDVQLLVDELTALPAPPQAKIDALTENYSKLSTEQKTRIDNYDEAIVLRECEIVAIQASNQLSQYLKNASSLEIYSAKVKMNATKLLGDGVLLEYSATNGFGGRVDGVACMQIGEDGTDPFWTLSLLTGTDVDKLSSTTYPYYLQSPEEEIEIDGARIADNRSLY